MYCLNLPLVILLIIILITFDDLRKKGTWCILEVVLKLGKSFKA